ncbi:MAG: bifunctional oligoribonuclease/PAP phosphatase NrnA [Bacilli bacterium]|nr:bifunctional oligoribonuclease/PAP phosphatase NrnA [Bacilli bacterium]
MITITSNALLKQIYKKIKAYDEIVIARHIGPDPDAIASQMALREAIKLTFPTKKVLAVGVGVAKFRSYGYLDKMEYENLNNPLLIVLDVPNMHRIDGIEGLNYKEIIKIDHHPKEDIPATIDWTEIEASSTCQMIAELLLNTKLLINEKIASNLFLGIISDSDRFVLKNTTSKALRITADLIDKVGLEFTQLYDVLYMRSMDEIRFQAYIANNIEITENNFGFIELTPEIIREYNVDFATASNMINNFNFINELLVWIFISFDEKNDIYKINLRSRGPVINTIANKYNGGGHKFASGCRIKEKADIENLKKDLDMACLEFLKERE